MTTKTKMTGLALLAASMLAACNAQQEKPEAKTLNLDSESARLSYAIGLDVGQSLKSLNADIDQQAFMAAVSDRLDGKEPRMDEQQAAKVKQAFFKARAEKQMAERQAQGKANKTAGEKFLAENARKPGVKVTASGLQYEVLKQGDGPKPKASDKVTVHYRGTLIDGTEFDSSYSRGQPATFPLNGVIKGWTEGVQLMNVGSKYRFYIPSELAYGERGAGNRIGPNSTLIFDVELLGIGDAKQAGGGSQ